jgi:uncharacterized membrane protein YheB (UPF0754 family)
MLSKLSSGLGLQAVISFMFGMLGAIIIVTMVQIMHPPESMIATVRITQLVDQFIKEERQKNIPQALLEKEIKQFGNKLEATLKKLAKENNLVIFPKEAVITTVPDVTDQIRENFKV